MGKSNCLKNQINNILEVNEIKILENINEKFSDEISIHFSNLIKHYVKLNFFSININTYTDNDKHIKYLLSNEIKILNSTKQFFIFFSDNLLSVFIDLLFGGNGISRENISKVRNITYIEKMTTKKILKLICNIYCTFFKKFFSVDLNLVNTKIFKIKKFSSKKENYISNYFNFSLNGIKIFFSIVFPVVIFKKNFQQITFKENNTKSSVKNIDLYKNVPVVNLYNIELEIIVKLTMIIEKKYNQLSVGDILIVQNPNKVIAYSERIPIFVGSYKNFDGKSVVFLRKFIYKSLDLK